MAEDAWNTRDPEQVAHGYTVDSDRRDRHRFLNGREARLNSCATNGSARRPDRGVRVALPMTGFATSAPTGPAVRGITIRSSSDEGASKCR